MNVGQAWNPCLLCETMERKVMVSLSYSAFKVSLDNLVNSHLIIRSEEDCGGGSGVYRLAVQHEDLNLGLYYPHDSFSRWNVLVTSGHSGVRQETH